MRPQGLDADDGEDPGRLSCHGHVSFLVEPFGPFNGPVCNTYRDVLAESGIKYTCLCFNYK